MYTLDDSSGLNIYCTLNLEPLQENPRNVFAPGPPIPPEYSDFDVGHVVDIRGPIVPYRRQKAIEIRRMKLVPTTQHELLLWEKRSRFRTEVLDVPWVLSDKEVRRCRKAAERADAKDLRLVSAKRKRRTHREDENAAAEKVDDPYKLKKRVARSIDARSDTPAHRPQELSIDAKVVSRHGKQPGPVSAPEGVSGGGNGEDRYRLKSATSKRPASSTAPRALPTQERGSQNDPSRTTTRGSGRPLKPSVQSSAVALDETSSVKEPSSSASKQPMSNDSRTRSSSSKHSSVGEVEPPKASQPKRSAPARKLEAQESSHGDRVDDPYAIKARYVRRTSASRFTGLGQDTPADPFKITKSRKGPCSEKIYNVDLRGSDKLAAPTTVSKPDREHGESGKGVSVDDPFKLRKRFLT